MFKKYKIPILPSFIVTSAKEAQEISTNLSFPVAVKAQVLSGGRGKRGLIQLANNSKEVFEKSKAILELDDKGQPVTHLLIEQGADITQEIFISMLDDRATLETLILFSMEGGVDIETLAKENPDAIEKFIIPFGKEVYPYHFMSGLAKRGLKGKQKVKVAWIIATLVTIMRAEDLQLAEINPLAITKNGTVIALDARVVTDDNAAFRHPERSKYLSEKLRYTPEEAAAKQAGMSYVHLGGEIGSLSVGAGLGMTTADLLEDFGGSVLNFLDVGGGANQDKVEAALKIMVTGGGDRLKVILINAFGGITRTDEVARGIITARNNLNLQIPIVVRLSGTNIDQAMEILKEAGMEAFELMEPAIQKAVDFSKKSNLVTH